MNQVTKYNRDKNQTKLKRWREKLEWVKDGQKCTPIKFNYSIEGIITLEYRVELGSEFNTQKDTFNESVLDEKLEQFKDKPIKTQAPPKYYTEQQEVIIYKQQRKTLQMSEASENNLLGLRNHLFSTLKKLEGGTMKADEAKAMAQVAQTIINSAKLEMEYKLLINDKPEISLLD